MVTRKVKHKVRDADKTKRELISAVGEILLEHGFASLDASKIARWIGKHRNSVKQQFGSLNDLLRTYIQQKDYWEPFFERFQLPESATNEQIRDMFSDLMQQNMSSFSADTEMQNVILWQISEVSSLMRSVSEAREAEGAKLLRLTDRHFKGSELNFRAVIALLLYGTYALTLHARNNKSSVCGIDINHERDWWNVHRTLMQIINLVWDAAAKHKTNYDLPIMNYEFENLENLAEEQARLRGTPDTNTRPAESLVLEVKKLKRKILSHLLSLNSQLQYQTYLQINLRSLVSVCDLLYDPEKSFNPDAELILEMIEAVRRNMNAYIPGNLAIPNIFRERENIKFQQQWLRLSEKMLEKGVDKELIGLAQIPFSGFAEQSAGLEWSDFKYLRKYARRMCLQMDEADADEQALLHTMIGLGFNDSRFIKFCYRQIESSIANQQHADKIKVLKRYKGNARQLIEYTSRRFDHYKKPVKEELINWVDAELDYIS